MKNNTFKFLLLKDKINKFIINKNNIKTII